jgi:hypothetical protein
MSRWFSEGHGYGAPAAEITIREDAPPDLRYAVAHIARMVGMTPKAIRNILCEVLFVAPDPNNWSDFPNIWEEVLGLLRECEWFKVYDVAEAIWRVLDDYPDDQLRFQDELNRLFLEKGIGWELKDPVGIVYRGGEAFTVITTEAAEILNHEVQGGRLVSFIDRPRSKISRRARRRSVSAATAEAHYGVLPTCIEDKDAFGVNAGGRLVAVCSRAVTRRKRPSSYELLFERLLLSDRAAWQRGQSHGKHCRQTKNAEPFHSGPPLEWMRPATLLGMHV